MKTANIIEHYGPHTFQSPLHGLIHLVSITSL